jgi:hypothetical protein
MAIRLLPIQITIENPSDVEYQGFDTKFLPGGGPQFDPTSAQPVLIAKAGVVGGINNCVADSEHPLAPFHLSMHPTGRPSTPIFQAYEPDKANIFEIRCNSLASHSKIDIVLALDHPIQPEWEVGDIQYNAVSLHRSDYPTHCYTVECSKLDRIARDFVGSLR